MTDHLNRLPGRQRVRPARAFGMLDVAIIGGGLCGLAVAEALQRHGQGCVLFEARTRFGGRILSAPSCITGQKLDLGPGWFWPETQPLVLQLLTRLGLRHFPQHDDGAVLLLNDPDKTPGVAAAPIHLGAHRLEGGMASLVEALLSELDPAMLRPGHVLLDLQDAGDHVLLGLQHGAQNLRVAARQVVLAVPPRLVEDRLRFVPVLEPDMLDALRGTPTWMAARAKLAVSFGRALWREAGQSGNALVSHPQAVLGEVFDACDEAGEKAALGGFVALSPEQRKAFADGLPLLMGNQLAQLFGSALQAGEQLYQDWATEDFTCSKRDEAAPATEQIGAGNPLLRRPHWQGKLHWAGSETAEIGAGLLEGALNAAARAAGAVQHRKRPSAATPPTDSGPDEVNTTSLARWRAWVAVEADTAFDQYRENVNRALARQARDQLMQRAILGTIEQIFIDALAELQCLPFQLSAVPVERGRCALIPQIQAPFGALMKRLIDDAIAFNRTSCALSNFPDEHRPSPDYVSTTLRDVGAAWQAFSKAANAVLLAKRAPPVVGQMVAAAVHSA
jgi:monoamine oxidase